MRRFLVPWVLLVSAILVGCSYDQAACTTGCGYVPTATYVATTSYVPTTTYVATTRYIPTTNYVSTAAVAPIACCSTNCCPTCNRCGSAFSGYGSGAGYGYGYESDSTGWY